MKKIKVLIIDDSSLVRELLGRILSADREIEVVGTAMDPIFAVKLIKKHRPDVITLDIEMPRMDGLSFLKKLMSAHPLPVIMISSWTAKGAEATLKALELGALDFVEKPKVGLSSGLEKLSQEIISKVKVASQVDSLKLKKVASDSKPKRTQEGVETDDPPDSLLKKTTGRIFALGGSTGGVSAVRKIIAPLPYDMEAVIVVLHMPAGFTSSYAEGLNRISRMNVKEAKDKESILKGHVYVAPGGKHLLLRRSGANYYLEINSEPVYNLHRPSVDKTFFSIADAAGENVAAFILTGMGSDGAEGLKAIKDKGGWTAVQDEKTSVVYGMPKQALAVGGADKAFPLDDISGVLIRWSYSNR